VQEIITGSSSAAFQNLSAEVSREVIDKIAQSMRNVWTLNLAGSALSFVLALGLKVSLRWVGMGNVINFMQREKLLTGAM
jgi:hypothetical protein